MFIMNGGSAQASHVSQIVPAHFLDKQLFQNKKNPLLTSLYTHNKYMAYVNSNEMLTIYLVLVVHE